jgi:hypothetical protein
VHRTYQAEADQARALEASLNAARALSDRARHQM